MIGEMTLSFAIRDGAVPESRELDGTLTAMDEEEFRAFYERTARPLWSYLSRMTGSRQEADDLLQEAYYRFYRAGARHESESHRRNSLFQIATNLVRDAARRSKRYEDVPIEEDSTFQELATTQAAGPERQAAVRTDLARALRKLEPVQREMIWLAYAQGVSHDEIAEIVGVRAVSVRTILLRARRKLAMMLSGESEEGKR